MRGEVQQLSRKQQILLLHRRVLLHNLAPLFYLNDGLLTPRCRSTVMVRARMLVVLQVLAWMKSAPCLFLELQIALPLRLQRRAAVVLHKPLSLLLFLNFLAHMQPLRDQNLLLLHPSMPLFLPLPPLRLLAIMYQQLKWQQLRETTT